jgi:hypothetical protein
MKTPGQFGMEINTSGQSPRSQGMATRTFEILLLAAIALLEGAIV